MLPRLLHPIAVEIEPLNRAESIVDPDFQEPVQQASRGPRVTAPAQVQWGLDEELRATLQGAEQGSDGYLLFRTIDLRALSVTLHQGDRFVSIGVGANKIDADLYVTALRYNGHYQDQGGATLVKAFFKDRFPSKQTRGGK